jgi:hypothetical protein
MRTLKEEEVHGTDYRDLAQLPQFDQQVLGCQREEGRVSTT